MAPTFLEMAFTGFRPNSTRSTSSSSVMSGATGETSSQARLSNSSTPPTSAADSESIASTAAKLEAANDTETQHELESDTETDTAARKSSTGAGRSRRSRVSANGIYNVKVSSGTAVHAPRKFKNADGREIDTLTRRRTISGDTLVSTLGSANASSETVVKEAKKLVSDGIEALDLQWSVKKLPKSRSQIGLATRESPRRAKKTGNGSETSFRRATRSTDKPVENLTKKLSVLGKRGRDKFEASLVKAKRELRRLADTNEFAGIETKPVVAEVWSNGKLVTGDEPPKKKVKVETTVKAEEEKKVLEKTKPKKKGPKIWLNKGLYAGQQARNLDWFAGYSKEEKKKLANMPDFKPNGFLPLPMWHGQRLLHAGRNFKLPFDVCSPLPPGQPKPDEWRKVPKSELSHP
jgi:histone-lysine N-methyltransferase ASH1L